jgi:RNA polymerase sigma-70 factor (ECF subfamily)
MSPESDGKTATLIEGATRGDAVAVEALLERYLPGLEAFVRLRQGRMLKAKESAVDIVQSVCREILEHMERYQYRGEAQFKHWLYTTALRKLSNRVEYYRAQKRDAGREVALAATGGATQTHVSPGEVLQQYHFIGTPSQALQAREEMERIEVAFEKLTEEHREVILLSRMIGLTHREIAEVQGKTEGAVRVTLSRALAKLAGHLEKK